MPPVPQFCPLLSLPFAPFPGDTGQFGTLGAFPGLRVRDFILVYTHHESGLLFPLSHDGIICSSVSFPWTVASCPGDATVTSPTLQQRTTEQDALPRHADSAPPGRGRGRDATPPSKAESGPEARRHPGVTSTQRPARAGVGERAGQRVSSPLLPARHLRASPAPGTPRAGAQEPHSNPGL